MRHTGDTKDLPQYRSHKTVWALQIAHIDWRLDGPPEEHHAVITPKEHGYGKFVVDSKYLQKHNPQVGGYWVTYEDGYESWCPAEAFEKGNTLEGSPEEERRAIEVLGIRSVQVCRQCDQMWVNLNDRICRKCGTPLIFESTPGAVITN